MNSNFRAALIAFVLVLFLPNMNRAEDKNDSAPALHRSDKLQQVVDSAVKQTLEKFAHKNLRADQLAVTVADLADPTKPTAGSHRGGEQIYPASVIKMFYLAAAHRWLEDGKLKDSEELRRAMRDMIVDSYNEPTGYIVDLLTGTTSGPELPPDELEKWYDKRNSVSRYFASLGYKNINANRKPWCEGPYGREMQSVQLHKPNHRNWLTTDATAQLMTSIATGKEVSAKRSQEMMDLMKRDPFNTKTSPDGQSRGYTGMALPQGSKLWSKAGWTSETRHDAAYVELPTGEKLVLVTFTVGQAKEKEIIANVVRFVLEGISSSK